MKKRSISKNGVGSGILHKIFFVVVLGVLVYFAYLIFMGRREGFQSTTTTTTPRPRRIVKKEQTLMDQKMRACTDECYRNCKPIKNISEWKNCIEPCKNKCKNDNK